MTLCCSLEELISRASRLTKTISKFIDIYIALKLNSNTIPSVSEEYLPQIFLLKDNESFSIVVDLLFDPYNSCLEPIRYMPKQ